MNTKTPGCGDENCALKHRPIVMESQLKLLFQQNFGDVFRGCEPALYLELSVAVALKCPALPEVLEIKRYLRIS